MELLEKDYAHWLSNVPGIGNKTLIALTQSGMTCKEAYTASAKELSAILSQKQRTSLEKSRLEWNFEQEKKKLEEKQVRFVSILDPEYPDKLRHIPDQPFGLYVKGELPDPNVPSVAIIGARMCSDYGRYMARQFGRGLALSGVQVISGMARGIDGLAQHAALSAGGKSFAILGGGVDICYPEENRDVFEALPENGGLISEFPPEVQPISRFFPMRNRIISALSDILLVVEARQKSGTSITVDTALEQGREVLAVPGRVTDRLSDGCNYLISQGAGVAISVEDVLERLWQVSGGGYIPATKSSEGEKKACNGITGMKTANESENDSPEIIEDCEAADSPHHEPTMEDDILGIVDIIPVSTSFILEELYKKGRDTSVPVLMTTLMDMTCKGQIAQNGAYYRRIS
jgi:DNA processing protein